jgi:hypothetical protein
MNSKFYGTHDLFNKTTTTVTMWVGLSHKLEGLIKVIDLRLRRLKRLVKRVGVGCSPWPSVSHTMMRSHREPVPSANL